MTFEKVSATALDYAPCRYGASRTTFRGPAKDLRAPYVATLGGTETYGRFVPEPFADLLERRLGRTVVNFGCVNAGLDVFIADDVVMQACAEAALTVIQITGAQNMSNRFYTVHPRRNDRFLRASNVMQGIWPEIDFTDIHFTRHLLGVLKAASSDRFAMLERELAEAWVARMQALVRQLSGRAVLLWMADRRPGEATDPAADAGPLFVTREMIELLRPHVLDIVEVVAPRPYPELGTEGMVFAPLEFSAAEALPGPAEHVRAAEILADRLARHL
ncbi:DUF6473 family protein [Roseitranquillus sediminis]|uniref:DUF6473 family protein n=1 Tax=Roseitranquillus sediminis TaxID=2809051 RepID=UPI001D0CAF52|nr:DUF6473 family protein [Roseitranquillus sediminis]MBM9596306.1 hypothetical protein [Roseitranquillus sediminis]